MERLKIPFGLSERDYDREIHRDVVAERVGFEPTVPLGITGFQDQLLKPLGHLSMGCSGQIAKL